MTDVIYNYPKSSCTCYECDKDKFFKPSGVPTNMSVRDCKFSEYYDCYPHRIFKVQTEPQSKNGIKILNPSVVATEKFDSNFRQINVSSCPASSCKGTTYLNSDPRLFNAAGGTWMQLDRPPLVSTPKLNTLTTDKELNCYGQGYKTYADVNAGQIMYYINKSQEDAFFEPVFSKKATMVGDIYQDPMGNIKPQYNRVPVGKYNPILGDPCDIAGEFCLSSMKDSQYFREDIMALQQRKHNEQRYAPRWTNNQD